MCGICGIINPNHGEVISLDVAQRMVRSLIHRGPDEEGFYLNREGNVFLGHRRLSIIDLAGGKQPMANHDETLWIVFNGEIYNFRELRRELERRGCRFATRSDTEVILQVYEEYGEAGFERLNGIFAFAIYNLRTRELILARDHFGVKPLYYMAAGQRLIFGSEIKAILEHPAVSPMLDYEAFDTFLTLRYNPSPQTLIKGIEKLYPGYCLKYSANGEVTLRSYWNYRPRTNTRITEPEAIEEYQRLLEQAVQRQMVSDVPVGLLLSGGVDSATIGHLMQQCTGEPIKTFTIGFSGEGSYNELEDARASARHIGSDHHELTLSKNDYLKFFIDSFYYTEEPIAESTIPALYYVSHLAAQHLKVVLSGQGADEPLAGYHRYLGERYLNRYSFLLNSLPARAIAYLLPRNERIKRAVYASRYPDELNRFLAIYTIFTEQQKNGLLNSFVRQAAKHDDRQILERFAPDITGLEDSLSRLMFIDTRLSLSDNLLLFGDKMTMANSLECRVPFLDLDLVRFLESLPSSFKLRGTTRKYIHKKSVAKWLPDEIIYRTKRGFETPVDEWLQSDFSRNAKMLFNRKDSACRLYFNLHYVNEMLDLHYSRRENYLRHIFALLSFELWHKVFLEKQQVDHEMLTHVQKIAV